MNSAAWRMSLKEIQDQFSLDYVRPSPLSRLVLASTAKRPALQAINAVLDQASADKGPCFFQVPMRFWALDMLRSFALRVDFDCAVLVLATDKVDEACKLVEDELGGVELRIGDLLDTAESLLSHWPSLAALQIYLVSVGEDWLSVPDNRCLSPDELADLVRATLEQVNLSTAESVAPYGLWPRSYLLFYAATIRRWDPKLVVGLPHLELALALHEEDLQKGKQLLISGMRGAGGLASTHSLAGV